METGMVTGLVFGAGLKRLFGCLMPPRLKEDGSKPRFYLNTVNYHCEVGWQQ